MHSKYYNADNKEVPSVTTVLNILNKDGLIRWANLIGKRGIDYERFLQDRANFGSVVHELIESDLLNKEPCIIGYQQYMADAMELVDKFKLVKQDLAIANVMSEVSLSCDSYGGTLDIICDIATECGPITVLGDFKTSKTVYDTQFIQLGAYLNLVKINMPEVYDKIQQCVIFSITKDKILLKYISKENCEKYFTTMFLSLLEVYKAWNTIKDLRSELFLKSTSY